MFTNRTSRTPPAASTPSDATTQTPLGAPTTVATGKIAKFLTIVAPNSVNQPGSLAHTLLEESNARKTERTNRKLGIQAIPSHLHSQLSQLTSENKQEFSHWLKWAWGMKNQGHYTQAVAFPTNNDGTSISTEQIINCLNNSTTPENQAIINSFGGHENFCNLIAEVLETLK